MLPAESDGDVPALPGLTLRTIGVPDFGLLHHDQEKKKKKEEGNFHWAEKEKNHFRRPPYVLIVPVDSDVLVRIREEEEVPSKLPFGRRRKKDTQPQDMKIAFFFSKPPIVGCVGCGGISVVMSGTLQSTPKHVYLLQYRAGRLAVHTLSP